ncbi:SDR family NAD(P)-dependent oxidoreductase [Vibrio tasmaniensis]|nr:SDR family NAD(P)-dependent oxidoreductase [Vibrio sp. L3-7]TVU79168.1 SDR family NAD(P)-dependent oxidoreductase [Vibrio tasmaniensis]
MPLSLIASRPPKGRHRRVISAIIGQKRKHHACPELPRLDGKRVLVTGGAAGIGEFITRSLLAKGARVTSLARGLSDATDYILHAESIYMDLADPKSIVTAVEQLGETPFDIVICNAGLVSKKAEISPSGYEKTFSVNVLGHHILYRLLMQKNMLVDDARLVITSGDIYILANECAADIPFDCTSSAYSRSKLGNLWQVRELSERYPNIHPIAVHPGVVASGFAGSKKGFLAWFRTKQLVSEEQGSHSSLIGATQGLPRGSYWHNVFGLVDLPENDPGCDGSGSRKLWDQLESIAAPYLQACDVKLSGK